MIKEVEKNGKKYYECELCGLVYNNKDTAEQCEKFCEEHKGCNLCNSEITEKAIKLKEE